MYVTRLATAADAPAIAQLQYQSWRERGIPSDECVESEISDSWKAAIVEQQHRGRVLVTEEDAALVGFASIEFVASSKSAILHMLEVEPRHRRRSVGSRLLNASLDVAATMGAETVLAWVSVSEISARELLTSSGWAETGARRTLSTGNNSRQRDEMEFHTTLI
ncbi:MAG: GNAT family N-acetyltransferase [Candidatus Nanopelagicales bacterium]|nr:GNAT family N-acetyltransferase [Candidatus Nanopelagicales bacterium]